MLSHCVWQVSSATMTNAIDISPQDRLATSRRAIVRYMRDGRPSEPEYPGDLEYGLDAPPPAEAGKWQFFKNTVHSWWQHHPAHLAVALLKPALSRYAEQQPLRLLGLAAGAGAALIWVRPWRLVSITGLIFTTLKSSEVSTLVLSLLSRPTTKTSKESHD